MESNNEQFEIFSFTHGGANLLNNFDHLNAHGRETKTHSINAIEPEKWDIIILQQGSVAYYIKNSFETTLKTIQLFKEKLKPEGKLLIMENYPSSYKYPIEYCGNFSDFANYEIGDPENIVCSDTIWNKEDEIRLLKERFDEVKQSCQVEVIPMIDLVNFVVGKHSKTNTFIEGYHPSPILSQFMAFRFYSAITGNVKVDTCLEEMSTIKEFYNSIPYN